MAMTPATAKTSTRKSPRKTATAKASARKSPPKPATAQASARKAPSKPASAKAAKRKSPPESVTKTARSRPAASRTTSKLAQVPAKTAAAQLASVSAADTAAAKMKFEQGILVRYEAVLAGKPLPPGATHEIIGKTPDGFLILKRKRFSLT